MIVTSCWCAGCASKSRCERAHQAQPKGCSVGALTVWATSICDLSCTITCHNYTNVVIVKLATASAINCAVRDPTMEGLGFDLEYIRL
jgi:hypothetical protein